MSEYWVSHKKYFCKYCNIYIADDAPSRRQHESGLRHKGNVERFVRGLYKEGEKRKQDREEEKRDMARVEQAAQAAFARDVSAGLVKPGSSGAPVASSSSAAQKPAPKPSNPFADYSTAESLGYTDPDAERLNAEAERRRTQGVAGEWEVISVSEPTPGEAEAHTVAAGADGAVGQKREAELPPDEDDTRRFKLRRKTVGVGLGEIYDPGLIPIKVKKKEETPDALPPPGGGKAQDSVGSTAGATGATEMPKWSARGWKKPGERIEKPTPVNEEVEAQAGGMHVDAQIEGRQQVKAGESALPPISELAPGEGPPASAKTEDIPIKPEEVVVKLEAKETETATPATGFFRKRKLPAGGASSRGRRT